MAFTRLILAASALTFVTMLATTDFRTHRIPNRLTIPAAIAALLINVGIAGRVGALYSASGLVVGFVAFLPLFLAGGLGAGDVKGMAAIGAFVGPYGAILAACWTLIAGLVGGLVLLLVTGGWPAVRRMLGRWSLRTCVLCVTAGTRVEAQPGDPARRRFPYGFALACGTAASVILTVTR